MFRIQKKKLIVELNEDGFTLQNVRAIVRRGKAPNRSMPTLPARKVLGLSQYSALPIGFMYNLACGPSAFATIERTMVSA